MTSVKSTFADTAVMPPAATRISTSPVVNPPQTAPGKNAASSKSATSVVLGER